MWQTKYASAVPKNLELGLNFRLCSEGYFLSWRPQSVLGSIAPFFYAQHSHVLLSQLGRILKQIPNMYSFWFLRLSGEERVKMLIRTLQQIVKFENCDRHLEYITYQSFISAFPQKSWIQHLYFCWQTSGSRDNIWATQ